MPKVNLKEKILNAVKNIYLQCQILNRSTFHRFAALKQKVVRNNNQPFMTETLRKAIMKRSKLKNKFNKERNAKKWPNYKQQRNYCSNLLKESKARHFNNLNVQGTLMQI